MSAYGTGTGGLTSVVADPTAVLGAVATALGDGQEPSAALSALVSGLALRGAALRTAAGDLVGSAGEVLREVGSGSPVLELPVQVRGGAPATLTVTGARPSHLTALRAAAAVLGLGIAPVGCASLMEAAEAERDALADALHDGPVQAAVVSRLAAEAAVRGGDPEYARDAAQVAVVELRRALWQIRPRGAAGLSDALEQLSAQRVEGGLPALRLVLAPGVDLDGPAGGLAYRVVQTATGKDSRVGVRRDGASVVVDVEGTLPTPELWAARARSLGGDLYSSAGHLRLVLPLVTTSARTAP